MTALVWAVQALLAAIFFTGALVRATRYDFAKSRMAWVGAIPRRLLLGISGAEVLGALGLVLPGLTRTAPLTTPIAALALVVVQLLAIAFHVRRGERRNAQGNAALTAGLAFVTVTRLALPL